ncbi:MAG: acetate--CoA ligase family protein [Candidatus Methanofastidiosia archaeon]
MKDQDSSQIKEMFYPKTIAVIGASPDKKKIGYEIFKNLQKFTGKVYPVNKKEDTILDQKTFDSVLDIDDQIDLVIIAIPVNYVKTALEECGKKNVKGAVIISAGFSEIGKKGLEEEIVQTAKKYSIRLIGPNSAGIANNDTSMNATFIMDSKKGHISFVSQSGALGAAIIYKTVYEGIGFSKFISLGNMADIGFCEAIEFLAADKNTKSIALYMEGVKDGKRFIQVAKSCSKKKPILVLKSGKTRAGSQAVSSHTGSLAGNDSIYDTAFKQAGVIRTETIDSLLDAADVFSQNHMERNNVVILTNAGGPGILAADECEKQGFNVPTLSQSTQNKLKKTLSPYASTRNPVDTTAQAGYKEYLKCIKILQNDNDIDAIAAVIVVPTFIQIGMTEHARGIIDGWNKKKPLVTCFMSGEVALTSKNFLSTNSIPCYPSPERAVKALSALWKFSRWKNEN